MKKLPKKYVIIASVLLFFLAWVLLSPSNYIKEITYTDFLVAVDSNKNNDEKIESLQIDGSSYLITFINQRTGIKVRKRAIGPNEIDYELIKVLKKQNIQVTFKSGTTGAILYNLIFHFVPNYNLFLTLL